MQFQGPNDVGIGAPCIVVFIPEWPQLAGNEHKPRAGVFVEPLAHRFIDAVDPTWDKIGGHVLVPFVKHLTHFPKPALVCWWIEFCLFYTLQD